MKPNDQRDEPLYGWVMVALAPLFLGFGIGSLGAISVFLKPLATEFGWLRGETAFAYLACQGALGLGGILMGHLADRYSTRRVVFTGSLVIGLAYLAMARQSTLWEFYLYSTLAGGVGAAAFFAPLLANVGGWFNRNKGLALGIATAGQALGQGIVPYLSSFLIDHFDWRVAYNSLGVFALAGLLPLALLIRTPPGRSAPAAKLRDESTNEEAPREKPHEEVFAIPPGRAISILSIAVIFCCIPMATPMVHVVALASDGGLDAESAARVLLTIMVAGFFGRIFFGKLTDRIGGLPSYLLASAWQTATVFWFVQVDSPRGFFLLAGLFGFGYGGVMTCLIICAQGFAPSAHAAKATAMVALFGFIGMGIGGYQGGFFFDLTGDYVQSYANAAYSGILNLMIVGGLYWLHTKGRHALAAQAASA